MTRGRKKDMSITPTRALVQQRDYRARKANYIAELEDRVRKAEAENAQLRKDLEATRAALSIPADLSNSQVVEASRNLMQHLSLVTGSLNRFQQIVFPETMRAPVLPPLQLPLASDLPSTSRTLSFPSSTPFPPFSQPTASRSTSATPLPSISSSFDESPNPRGRKRFYRGNSPEPPVLRPILRKPSSPSESPNISPSSESECCFGILDCRGLYEEEEDNEGEHRQISRTSMTRRLFFGM
ncbi:hypothetical protein Agabi119p4_2427 [Agaricus bisporus var. burnettii]|uniref:BZIP domain-containing protein n=1 Tax=Agaricus bisporus var. burnettii TaxID=192524 RepID=A0A8H7F904_AGABI|nr:hypothetical protein Agabi119p4_2427 [Agaricus bisporus var. burnettii]